MIDMDDWEGIADSFIPLSLPQESVTREILSSLSPSWSDFCSHDLSLLCDSFASKATSGAVLTPSISSCPQSKTVGRCWACTGPIDVSVQWENALGPTYSSDQYQAIREVMYALVVLILHTYLGPLFVFILSFLNKRLLAEIEAKE